MSKNSLLSTALFKDLTSPAEPETSEHEIQMRTLREKVMKSAEGGLEQPPALPDQAEVKQLQQKLDAARFRTSRKETLRKALEFQLQTLKSEQEATFPLEQATHSATFVLPSESVSQSEFNTTMMWEQKCTLEDKLSALSRKMDAEALLSEQMAYLLQNTKDSTKAARLKSDQLRYLQKRLLKRYDEIVTMHTRAENEYLHASHQTLKATEEADLERNKRGVTLGSKQRIAEMLKNDVERMCESVARRQFSEQEAETRRQKAATQLSAIELTHRNIISMQSSAKQSVSKANFNLSQLDRFLSSPFLASDGINAAEIISAFHRMQFQNSSLNERFSSLSEQENKLKMTCMQLRDEMEDMKESLEGTAALQTSMKANSTVEYTTFNQMITLLDHEDDSQGLEKRVRAYESFSLALVHSIQEAIRRQLSFVSFIGSYAGGHLEKLNGVVAGIEGNLGEKSLGSRLKSQSKVQSVNRRLKERGSEPAVDLGKEETAGNAALARLREELTARWGNKHHLSEIVLNSAGEILPIRVCTGEVIGKTVGETEETEERKTAMDIITALIREGHATMRSKAEEGLKTIRVLMDGISSSKAEVKEMLSSLPLSAPQKQLFLLEKNILREKANGPPLKDIPEKLAETISTDFEIRVKTLAGNRRSEVGGSVDHVRPKPAEEPSLSYRVQETERDATQELEEQALLSSERRLMRLGLSPQDKLTKSDAFISEKISALSSIRRAADLEKKLLEQVQGVESKLKRIKSRGEA